MFTIGIHGKDVNGMGECGTFYRYQSLEDAQVALDSITLGDCCEACPIDRTRVVRFDAIIEDEDGEQHDSRTFEV